MKHINKRPEPDILREWRETQEHSGVNCLFVEFQGKPKQETHQSLLNDQGWICCYCCQAITEKLSHIEHFDPQSLTKDAQGNNPASVTYQNLLASCGPLPTDPNDPNQRRTFPKHCGDYRKDNIIPISPLDSNCESYFVYNISTGDIEADLKQSPQHQKEADRTIKVLNLNDEDIKRKRLDALYGFLLEHDIQDPQDAALLLTVCYQKEKDGDGHYKFDPFCVAIAYFLRSEFGLP